MTTRPTHEEREQWRQGYTWPSHNHIVRLLDALDATEADAAALRAVFHLVCRDIRWDPSKIERLAFDTLNTVDAGADLLYRHWRTCWLMAWEGIGEVNAARAYSVAIEGDRR